MFHTRSWSLQNRQSEVLGTALTCAYRMRFTGRHCLRDVWVLYKRRSEIRPNEQWVLDGGVGCVLFRLTRIAASWKNRSSPLTMSRCPMFQELERWYDVHVFIANEIRDMKFTGIFPRYADMDKNLNIVELATGYLVKWIIERLWSVSMKMRQEVVALLPQYLIITFRKGIISIKTVQIYEKSILT